jgi:hypothetical protein
MPTHFHFLIHADQRTIKVKKVGLIERNILSEAVRNLLQTYTKAINKQNNMSGSLFQQNTKSKCLSEGSRSYGETCFHYNHQNPMKARLVNKMEEWDYSSFIDYAGLRKGSLCNKDLAFKLFDFNPDTFYQDSYNMIRDDLASNIF